MSRFAQQRRSRSLTFVLACAAFAAGPHVGKNPLSSGSLSRGADRTDGPGGGSFGARRGAKASKRTKSLNVGSPRGTHLVHVPGRVRLAIGHRGVATNWFLTEAGRSRTGHGLRVRVRNGGRDSCFTNTRLGGEFACPNAVFRRSRPPPREGRWAYWGDGTQTESERRVSTRMIVSEFITHVAVSGRRTSLGEMRDCNQQALGYD